MASPVKVNEGGRNARSKLRNPISSLGSPTGASVKEQRPFNGGDLPLISRNVSPGRGTGADSQRRMFNTNQVVPPRHIVSNFFEKR